LQVYCGADFDFLSILSEFLPTDRPTTILDAGANIGAATLLFSHLTALTGRIFSVEASPTNINVLRGNVKALGPVVTVIPKAIVSDTLAKSGHVLNFTGDSNQYWAFRVDHTSKWDSPTRVTHQVESISLPMIQVRSSHTRSSTCRKAESSLFSIVFLGHARCFVRSSQATRTSFACSHRPRGEMCDTCAKMSACACEGGGGSERTDIRWCANGSCTPAKTKSKPRGFANSASADRTFSANVRCASPPSTKHLQHRAESVMAVSASEASSIRRWRYSHPSPDGSCSSRSAAR
jgi:FkbM family methyltransferase